MKTEKTKDETRPSEGAKHVSVEGWNSVSDVEKYAQYDQSGVQY